MPKIVINKCYGGFRLSKKACEEIGLDPDGYHDDLKRDDPELVAAVEKLGDEANGAYAELKVVDVPDGTDWEIQEYDGVEWVAETHRIWD